MSNMEDSSSHSATGSQAADSPETERNASTESSLPACIPPRGRGYESVKGLNSKVFEEARIVVVDPLDCISIKRLRSRSLCRWGVQMIKDVILGGRDGRQRSDRRSDAESFIQGFVNTGKYSVLVEIPVERSELIVEHFMDVGKTEEEGRTLASSKTWYLIIDGAHIHQALMELIHEFSENFAGFRWPVVVISWQSEPVHQTIARSCHEMQKEGHYIDFPLPDAMQSLRNVIEEHSKKTGVALVPGARVRNGFIKEVMEIYSGGSGYSSSTLRCLCGIVLKMSSSFVATMRALLTEECDEYWNSLGSKRPFGRDTRVFKKLISSQSLKKAGLFLNYDKMTDEDRVNVIHRLRFIARERESFKAFQPSEIETQSRCVVAAMAEVAKFEEFLGDEPWPKDLMNLKRNILQTTLLDGDVTEHVGAGKQLLPTIVSAYIKATAAHGSQKIDQFRRRLEMDEGGECNEVVGTSACRQSRRVSVNSNVINTNGSAELLEVEEIQGTVAQSGDVTQEDGICEDPDVGLKKCGIEIQSANLLEFEKHHAHVGLEFDFVIADPYQKVPEETAGDGLDLSSELVDEKGITLFVQCIRRLLCHGGYCFIFLDWNKLRQWTACCKESQFEIVCEPFLIVKDPERVQKMNTKGLQNIYDAALVVRKPTTQPVKFELQKTAPYLHLPECRMHRWCNVIDGVPPPAQRLTFKPSRAQVRPGERPCALYIEIFKTFCVEKGRILDPIAGALTTGLAAIASDRSCVLLETDDRCLSHAVPRLRDFANAKLAEMDAIALLSLGTGPQTERNSEVNDEDDNRHGDEEEEKTSPENADGASDQDTAPSVNNCGSPASITDHPSASYQSTKQRTTSPRSSLHVAGHCSEHQGVESDRWLRSSGKSRLTFKTSAFGASKRNRTIRSPVGPKQFRVSVQPGTPTSNRRSKRTRRREARLDD